MSRATLTSNPGIAAVVLPPIAFGVGRLLVWLVPGCQCDTGGGCQGCSALGALPLMLTTGGLVAALGAAVFVLLPALLLASVFNWLSRREDARADAALPKR